jgi:molybdopterin-guanine dinucleotide biosynthesis protein A
METTICGVILAGGRGRRMHPESATGGDKALLPLAGEPLINHVVRRIRPQVSGLVINANGDPARFDPLGLPVVPDVIQDRGPLGGLLAAMDWALANAPSSTSLLSVSTDTPFLPDDLVEELDAAAQGRPAVAMSAGRLHPVVGLWPLALRDHLHRTLSEGRFGAERYAHSIEAIAVPFTLRTIGSVTLDPFFNANTPDDLADAETILANEKK